MSVISSEIDCVARTCVVIEYNGIAGSVNIVDGGMRLPARLRLYFLRGTLVLTLRPVA